MNYTKLKHDIIKHFHSKYGIHSLGCGKPFKGAEHHHILHRHEGGNNDPTNLVWLPFKAHRLIHKLDSKIDPTNSAKRHAYLMMYGYTEKAKAAQLEYARLKGKQAFLNSSRFTGKTQSDFQKIRCSETHTGKTVSLETRKKLSEARKGKPPWNKGIKLGEGYYKSK
jgi:hypothetical protein